MKLNKVIIIAVVIVIICFAILGSLKIIDNKKIENNSKDNNLMVSENEKEEITIYDIEDGYINVLYNNLANKHEYQFDNSLKRNGEFYEYEDEKYKSKIGIDVSSYQGDIDWKKVKDAGVEFAILRLGFRGYGEKGIILIDEKFEENYQNAINNEINIGVYFFSQAINSNEVNEEIEMILNNIKDKKIEYPVIFDLEKIKNDSARTDNLTQEEITNLALEFCNKIKESGFKPCVYGNAKTFTTRMKLESLNDYEKWYADYMEKPLYPYDFNIWQYTENGKIDGIAGNVDINICFEKK